MKDIRTPTAILTAVLVLLGLMTPIASASVPMASRTYLYASAGRSGVTLGTIWVTASLSSSRSTAGVRVRLERRTSAGWIPAGTRTTDSDGRVTFTSSRRTKGVYRLVFAGSGHLRSVRSQAMTVPAAPGSSTSRYYVFRDRRDTSFKEVLRIFADGTTVLILSGDLEFRCAAGRLTKGILRLVSFDFGGGRWTDTITGGWKNLRYADGSPQRVKGPLRALSGPDRRDYKRCAQPTFAVSEP